MALFSGIRNKINMAAGKQQSTNEGQALKRFGIGVTGPPDRLRTSPITNPSSISLHTTDSNALHVAVRPAGRRTVVHLSARSAVKPCGAPHSHSPLLVLLRLPVGTSRRLAGRR